MRHDRHSSARRLMPLLLTMLTSACATPSVVTPRMPDPPKELMEPIPQESYSESARKKLLDWQRRLIEHQRWREGCKPTSVGCV